MRCPSCNADNPPAAKFCIECGCSFKSRCTKCGADNLPQAKFCAECGTTLSLRAPVSNGQSTATPTGSGVVFAEGLSVELNAVPEGERKTVTALFADIKGSTELMEDLDPEEARAIIDSALKLMIDAVQRYGGHVVQSTGDGIFALFGAPVAHEDHPQRGVYPALWMQDEIKRFGERLRVEKEVNLQMRVGVLLARLVVRTTQTSAEQKEYTPIGHSTGLASRLEEDPESLVDRYQ